MRDRGCIRLPVVPPRLVPHISARLSLESKDVERVTCTGEPCNLLILGASSPLAGELCCAKGNGLPESVSGSLCRDCVGWLSGRVGAIDVTPTLPVVDMAEAVRFCEAAGLDVQRYDDGFAFVHLNEQSVFDLDLVADMDPASNHAGCYVIIGDVDAWHARLVEAGLNVTAVEDRPWGMHEFTLTDPSGNNIRVGRNLTDDEKGAL